MIFELYKKFVVNSPTLVLFVLPSIIFIYSASLPIDITTYNIALGTCEFAKFSFDASNKSLYNILGLILIVSSIIIQFNFLRKTSIDNRLEVYKKWRFAGYFGLVSLIPIGIGIICNVKEINPLNITDISIIGLFLVYIAMIFISEVVAKKKKTI